MMLVGKWTALLAILLVCCHHPVNGRGASNLVFVANQFPPGIYVAQADTFNFTVIPGTSDPSFNPLAVDYDPVSRQVYWTDFGISSIQRVFLNGTGLEVLVSNIDEVDGLTLDIENRLMYWTDAGKDLIEKATMDGNNRMVVVSLTDSLGTTEVKPRAIILDTSNSYLFWTDWGTAPKIERANTDGSDRMILVDTGLGWPNGLAMDSQGDRLYWCDATTDKVESSDLNGQDRRIIGDFSLDDIRPFDIAVYDGFVYLTDKRFGIIRSNLQNIAIEHYGTTEVVDAGGLHIYEVPKGCESAPCLNEGICVNSLNGYTCNCLAGYSGSRCEIDLVQCQAICSDGGDCEYGLNNFTCTCRPGFNGARCDYDIEPPMVTGCPNDTTIPVTMQSSQVTHSWNPPVFTDNSGTPFVSFGCSSTGYYYCHMFSSGNFSVGKTEVMFNATDGAGNKAECSFIVTVTVVDIICPMNLSVIAEPGDNSSSVDWNEPVVTGWNGQTSLTSSLPPGTFLIGIHKVDYTQRFEQQYMVVLECSFFISVGGQCDVISSHDSTLDRTIKWQPTEAGQTAKSFQRCTLNTTNAGEPIAVRDCLVVDPPLYFEWEANYTLLDCGEAIKLTIEDVADRVEVTEGNAEEVAIFLKNRTQDNSAVGDEEVEVEDVADILIKIADAGSGNPEVAVAVVETVNNILVNQNTNDDLANDNGVSSSGIVQSVEAQISSTLQQEGMVSIQQPSLHVEGVSLDPMEANGGFSFVSVQQPGGPQEIGTLEGTEVKTFNTSEIPPDIEVVASAQLPQNIGEIVRSVTGENSSRLQASFIVYASDDLFQSSLIRDNNSSIEVAGPVVSLTVEGLDLVNLTEPLVIEIQVSNNASTHDNTSFRCVFWDFTKADGVGDWSTAGCVLARQTDNTVSCNCSHATNFAILVDVHGQTKTDDKFELALDVISQIGIVLSIIALGATLIIYLSIKKLRTGLSRQIFIHFCVSLLLLYIVFIAGIDSARGSEGACAFVAALLHYLALTTMMWMAVEARNMYVSTVKVFPEDTSRYILKACLVAWGSPLIVVTITLASATQFYGSEHNCFLKTGLALTLGLLVPIALILLHNIITFILVMRSLLKIKEASRSQQISKRLQNAIGISALMGLTWVFGFLAIGTYLARFAFQLIFCLANSLQGVVICIMFCFRREEVRTAMEPCWRRICCGRTCKLPAFHSDKTHKMEGVTSSTGLNSPTSANSTAQYEMSMSLSAAPE
ncbi:uncharacterized protein LOC117300656 [Asterias rubens]|uniref:uncharacterized protein LOC117300656 n=1 Tax=Asterias rubens TaxID=7604 RepID=UPI00145503AC|nr:uncharacterized protein LOC117300656 [Asterias rubens]